MNDAIHEIGHRRGEGGFAGKRRPVEYVSFGEIEKVEKVIINLQLISSPLYSRWERVLWEEDCGDCRGSPDHQILRCGSGRRRCHALCFRSIFHKPGERLSFQ